MKRPIVLSATLAFTTLAATSLAQDIPAENNATPSDALAKSDESVTTSTDLAEPQAESAQPIATQDEERPSTLSGSLSLLGGIGYSYGFATAFGVGIRGQWAVVPKGFLHALKAPMHDELAIEPGVDYFHASADAYGVTTTYNEVTPLVGVAWNFWLTQDLVVYPKFDIGFRIGSVTSRVNGTNIEATGSAVSPLYLQGAAGVGYRLGPVALRAEVGWQAFRLGAGINIF